MQKITIIGAGLSGLYAAYQLQNHYDVTLLEARSRLGGRIHTIDGFDMGPSWVWPHQKQIIALIKALGLELFSQHTEGNALYHTHQGVQQFMPQPAAPSYRLKGGLSTLIEALSQHLTKASIHYNQEVLHIQKEENKTLTVSTVTDHFCSDFVIATLPPRLSGTLRYTPPLPSTHLQQLLETPTWMGHTLKCVIHYETNFWRQTGLSGFVFSHEGPLSEIHDASTATKPALFGFSSSKLVGNKLEQAIRLQLQTLFGDVAAEPKALHLVDWRDEAFSSTPADSQGLRAHPNYGFNLTHFDDTLFFIGTESSFEEGGYLEGALLSAKKVTNHLFSK
ncbi:MAG TPA: FAD-dependent oxidoreductase [Helicobacteraceae bacterium]|nr:FAD-dependent oxidoreductase [Helicobacteraceae bacterium]